MAHNLETSMQIAWDHFLPVSSHTLILPPQPLSDTAAARLCIDSKYTNFKLVSAVVSHLKYALGLVMNETYKQERIICVFHFFRLTTVGAHIITMLLSPPS